MEQKPMKQLDIWAFLKEVDDKVNVEKKTQRTTRPAYKATQKTKKKSVRKTLLADEEKKNKVMRGELPDTPKKLYREYKPWVLSEEAKNDSKLILMPWVAKEWMIMGGNSALFYTNVICPQLTKRPAVIKADTDFGERFRYGIVFLRSLEHLQSKLNKLGITKCEEVKPGLYVFDLGRKFSPDEIKQLAQIEYQKREKIRAGAMPKILYKDVHGLMLKLVKTLPPRVKRMDKKVKQTFGDPMMDSLRKIMRTYTEFANGNLEPMLAARRMCREIDNLKADVFMIEENDYWDVTSSALMMATLADLEKTINARFCIERLDE